MDEFAKIVEKDGALDRRFQKIVVEPTDIQQSITILENLKDDRFLEQYAREHYLMKREDETIYLLK